MARRNQPYLPLYVQDLLTDEKLIECSAEAHGIYLRLLCILHKQEKYGLICLKQKYKQNTSKFKNFASLLCKQMPFDQKQIENCIEELHEEKVINITDDTLFQKRMVKDGELSDMRSEIGKTGGSNVTKQYGKTGYLYLMSDGETLNKIGVSVNPKNRLYRLRSDLKLPKSFELKKSYRVRNMGIAEDYAHEFFNGSMDGEWVKGDSETVSKKFDLLEANFKAKTQANSEYEYENENEYVNKEKGGVGEKENEPSDFEEVKKDVMKYFGFTEFTHYQNMASIHHFLTRLYRDGNFENFKIQFDSYKTYKSQSGEMTHSFPKFLGEKENGYTTGGWNQENWLKKLTALNTKPKEKDKLLVGQKLHKPGKVMDFTQTL